MKSNLIYDYVERLSELLKVDARQAGATFGLQPVQLEVLHYLSICNRYSDTPIAVTEYLGLTKGTVSQTLKVLEKKELLLKQVDENDKRITHLKLTAKGIKLVSNIIPTSMFESACASLPDKTRLDIESSLRQLLITLLDVNGLKTFGVCKSCRYNSKTENGGYFCGLVGQPLSASDVQLICREHENA